jgi:prophage regulatory protein
MHQPDRIIRLSTVLVRTGLSRSTIYRKIAEGTFPTQIKISIHGAGWRESDINRWIEIRYHGGRGEKAMKSDKAGCARWRDDSTGCFMLCSLLWKTESNRRYDFGLGNCAGIDRLSN